MRRWVAAAALCAAMGVGMVAEATVYNVDVLINGAQEPSPSLGTGMAQVMFDDVSGAMSVNGTFSGLTSNANNAHVHGYAPLGTNAGVVFGLTFTPSTSGTVSGSGTIPAADIQKVLDGLSYINIHSGQFPGGEIRGQIIIPEPAALGLAALAAPLILRRRR